jgi:hypothetical protein
MKGNSMRLILMTAGMALTVCVASAPAQTMYKCVGPDGKTSYGDRPCSGKVLAKKEIDVRANLDDIERDSRRKSDKAERAGTRQDSPSAEALAMEQAEQQVKLMEGTDLDRQLAAYAQLKAATQQRVKEDEAARAEASRLWHCRRGPAPEKCQ